MSKCDVTPRIERIVSGIYRIIGKVGSDAGWIERSYLKDLPWRACLISRPLEHFRTLKEAKEYSISEAKKY